MGGTSFGLLRTPCLNPRRSAEGQTEDESRGSQAAAVERVSEREKVHGEIPGQPKLPNPTGPISADTTLHYP